MIRALVTLLACCLLIAAAQETGEARAKKRKPLQVTYLANSGFLVEAGETSFVIDAFLEKPYSAYVGLPHETAQDLEEGKGIFEDLDLALVSHVHRDHFQADFACRALEGTDAMLATSQQVLDTLHELCAPTRVQELHPKLGDTVSFEYEGIAVDAFRMAHGGDRRGKIQNLGQVIELEGWRVLHLGDADTAASVWAPHDIASRKIDVAFVPYWFWSSKEGRKIIEQRIHARHLIAVHVPRDEVVDVRDKLKALEGGTPGRIMVFEKGTDTHTFE